MLLLLNWLYGFFLIYIEIYIVKIENLFIFCLVECIYIIYMYVDVYLGRSSIKKKNVKYLTELYWTIWNELRYEILSYRLTNH